MTDIKQQLDASVGQSPRSSINVDETMRRMRRRAWRVRSTAVAATAGLVAAGVMLAWPISAGKEPPAAAPGPSQVELPAAAVPETEQEIAARLTAAVQAKLAQLLPGAALVANWPGHDAAVIYPERPVGVPTTLPWNSMRAQADLRDQQGTGFVDVLIGRTVAAPDATTFCNNDAARIRSSTGQTQTPTSPCAARASVGYPLGLYVSCADYDELLDGTDECTEHTTSAGDKVVMLRGDDEFRCDVTRADGTAVLVMSGAQGRSGSPRPTPSLTMEQMVDLATDPGLAL